MAAFTYIPVQTIEDGQIAIFNNAIPCQRGYVLHENDSGIVTLRGIVNNPCGEFARYHCVLNANIAVPTDGTVGEISVAIARSGEALQSSRARVTPTAVEDYFNVSSVADITVPRGCCPEISVENVSGQSINMQNAYLTITRVA